MQEQARLISAILIGAQIRTLLAMLLGILVFGTGGYILLADLSPVDGFYMTMITISTVGFGEIGGELNWAGRLLTILLIVLALTVLTVALGSTVEYVATGQLLKTIAESQRRTMISDMQDHFVVAGYGRVGQEVTLALQQEDVPFVVIDPDPELAEAANEDGILIIHGTATEDDTLKAAGIERARGVICAAGSDATNVYIVLTARGLNNKLFIISRASDESSEAKLLRAGADRVISPYILSGRRMANLAVRPFVVEFLDVTGSAGELEKTLEEIVVEEGSIIENRTIGEADLGSRTGALVLALYRSTGELLTNPRVETLLEPGTRMIVLGTRDALDVTEALARNFLNLSQEREVS
jgi:voltage-gated potassium channel